MVHVALHLRPFTARIPGSNGNRDGGGIASSLLDPMHRLVRMAANMTRRFNADGTKFGNTLPGAKAQNRVDSTGETGRFALRPQDAQP
jgi:hypothetical protein